MKQKLLNLDSVRMTLRPKLTEYLKEFGIDTNKNFACLNPEHQDKEPSMTCRQHPEQAYCFGCGKTVDIFMAAHYLEGKPISGPDWIEDNVLYLAKKYGVRAEFQELTQDEINEYRAYNAYSLASRLISDSNFGDYSQVDEEIEKRKWDKSKLSAWGIGTVDFDNYLEKMQETEFDQEFLISIDLARSNLFNKNNLIFTVFDDLGRPVGFTAKNTKYIKSEKKTGPKYVHTRCTGIDYPIFKKSERLYGLDIAKNAASPLYIFEGPADVITARHNGMLNCCCCLGANLTEHHTNLLKKYGLFNVVLTFDADEAGTAATQKAIDDRFAKEKDIRVKLCQLPNGMDPDDVIRKYGIEEFLALKHLSAFEWRMGKFVDDIGEDLDDENRREIAEKMTPIIVSEKSHIRQEEMCRQVARMTGFDFATISSEVKRLRSEKEANIQARRKNIIEAFINEIRLNPEETEIALIQAQNALYDISKSAQDDNLTSSTINMALSQKESDEAKTGDFTGFFMKPYGLGNIAARLNDNWRTDTWMCIGGSEQSAKTTLASQMAYEIADDHRNEAIVIYHSIDDTAKFILYKWICNAAADLRLELNHISSPKYWINQGKEFVTELREKGYNKIINMIKDERLVLKDSSDGQSVLYAESLIRYYRSKYPSKNIVLVIDNFHKLPDFAEINGHERTKRLSNHIKNMATQNHITIISTVEYRKLEPGEKPTNLAIAESRALQYDASVILHLYNEAHHKGENDSILVFKDEQGKIRPRIWCKFGKNKVCGFEGREFLDLYGECGTLRSVDLQTALEEQRDRVEFLKSSNKTEF